MISLSNRVHIFANPNIKDRLTEFFTNILDCEAQALPGMQISLFQFSNGASLSVEFTPDALDEQSAGRSVWLEVKTDDPSKLKQKVLAAGLPQVKYSLSDRFYFQAPGGQVWGILSEPVSENG